MPHIVLYRILYTMEIQWIKLLEAFQRVGLSNFSPNYDCNVTGAVWTKVVWTGAVWTKVVRTGAVWTKVVWTGAVWTKVVWTGAVWTKVVWTGVVWTE